MLTATRDIQPNEPVTSADFEPRWVDAFGGSTGALLAFPNQGPYASVTVIRAGQPLYQSALLRPIAVHPGDLVMVLVKNGPITSARAVTGAVASRDWRHRDGVNPTSGVPVMVTVTGPRIAELVMQ